MSLLGPRYLVVGADGLVGAGLVSLLEKGGAGVMGTTRRPEADGGGLKGRLFLDLASADMGEFRPAGYDAAFICAAITSMAACEDDPARTQQINVAGTVALAKRLLAEGTPLVFLSSNTVFDGAARWPNEDSLYSPSCEYGRQKAAVERQLLALTRPETPVAIVRLSKVLTPGGGMVAEFLRHLSAGEVCCAFDDLDMSPISLGYTTEALLTVARSGLSGIFHLAGEEEMSYAHFAGQLAAYLGADPSLVRPGPLAASAARVLFQPDHPGLGMRRARELLGIEPEPTTHLMAALVPQKFGAVAL